MSTTEASDKRIIGVHWSSRAAQIGFVILTVAGLILACRVLYQNFDLLTSLMTGKGDLRFLGVAALCLIGNQLLCITRWSLLVGVLDLALSFRERFDLAVGAEAAHLAMPGANGGDVVKLKILVNHPAEAVSVAASVIVDRLSGLIGMLLVGTVAGLLAWPTAEPALRQVTVATSGFLFAALLLIFSILGPSLISALQFLRGRWNRLDWLVMKFEQVRGAYQAKPVVLLQAALISFVSQGLTLSSFYFISTGLSPTSHAEWLESLIAGPWILISTALPLPGGALGVTEEISEELFGALGHRGGGLISMVYRLTLIASTSMLVTFWLVIRRGKPAPTTKARELSTTDPGRASEA